MQRKKGFTLIEVMVVVVIIGVIATLGITHYAASRELIYNQEAIAKLKLLQGAQRSYFLDMNEYYPAAGSEPDEVTINQNLRVLLSANANRIWDYEVWSSGCSRATRNGHDGRSWFLTIGDADGEPDSGAGCP